ncbi:family 10 glycosylhydrolase [Deinococcus lacus]|uniref:Family 10 glycosylhydrolase n=1 Tax=Deinococcus lacus TaxID=392561 RepID=A0ABW1YD88_9DEIO
MLERYRAETGAKGTPTPEDPAWQAWKRQQVTALVRRISLQTKAVRPDLWVSAATITYGTPPAPGDLRAFQATPAYRAVMQDWPTWMASGLIDLNVPMNYKRDSVGQQSTWFDGWNRFARSVQGSGQTASGTAIYLNSPQESAAQAARAVADGLGWVGYSYRTPAVQVYEGQQEAAAGRQAVFSALQAPGARWKSREPGVARRPASGG